MHGLFSSDAFRGAYLAGLGSGSSVNFEAGVEGALDALADHVERFMDIDLLLALADKVQTPLPA